MGSCLLAQRTDECCSLDSARPEGRALPLSNSQLDTITVFQSSPVPKGGRYLESVRPWCPSQ